MNDGIRDRLMFSRYFNQQALAKPRRELNGDDVEMAQHNLDMDVINAHKNGTGSIADFNNEQKLINQWRDTLRAELTTKTRLEQMKKQQQEQGGKASTPPVLAPKKMSSPIAPLPEQPGPQFGTRAGEAADQNVRPPQSNGYDANAIMPQDVQQRRTEPPPQENI